MSEMSVAALRAERRGTCVELVTRWRWLIACVAALLVYFPTFRTRPVFDDFAHVEFAARQGWNLLHMGPVFFRPIERILIGVNWLLFGANFWLVKLVAVAVLVLKAGLVHEIAKRIVSPAWPWAPAVIAAIFLAHPMHVSAVGKIDTVSEDLAALFALLVVLFAFVAAEANDAKDSGKALRAVVGAAVMVFFGMLSKEAFAGVAAATPFMFATALGSSQRGSRRLLAGLLALEGALGAGYLVLRHASGFSLAAPNGAGRYQLHFGLNVIKNIAAELGSIGFPGSTLAVFVRLDIVHVIISAGLLIVFVALFRERLVDMTFGAGTLPAVRRRAVLIVLLATVAAFFPTCLIPDLVSENQTALALPFVVLLLLACPLGSPPQGALARTGRLACLSLVAITWMVSATTGKVLAAYETSVRAYGIGDEILARYFEHPVPQVIFCFQPSVRSKPTKYSIFSLPDDKAAEFQLYRLRILNPAPVVSIVDLRQASGGERPSCTLSMSGESISRR
ncbi:MAG TPA: hypothetical protein VHB68_14135 [Steroidobacteraceae bacterium]|nr:hypothetical protein [Steroidobacteraceae bacterium]